MDLQTASPLVLDLQTHHQNSDITRGTEEWALQGIGKRGAPFLLTHDYMC